MIPFAIGKIKTAVGLVTIARADAIIAQPAVDDLVYEGDQIETGTDGRVGILFADGTSFQLYADARVVLDQFSYGAEKSSNSALLQVVKGMFGFIAGKMATTGRLIIDTPFAKIRNTQTPALTGGLTFSVFLLCLIREAEAHYQALSYSDLGKILPRDLPHGWFEILLPDGTIAISDNPEDMIVVKKTGDSYSVEHVPIGSAQLADLSSAYQAAFATLTQGTPFLKQMQEEHAAAPSTSGSGGSVPFKNELLLTTASLPTTTSTGQQNTDTGTGTGTGTGKGGGGPPVPIFSAVIKTLPITNDQAGPVYLGGIEPDPSQVSNPNVALTVTVVASEHLTNLKISGVPAGEQLFTNLDPNTGAFVPGVSVAYGLSNGPSDVFTILADDFRKGLWLSEKPGVSGTLHIVANVDGPGGVDPTPASADIVLTNNLQGPVHWIGSNNPASNGGDWSDPTKWSTGAVPIKFQDVIIDAPGNYTVTCSTGFLIDSLSVSSGVTLDITGAALFSIITANTIPLSNAGTILIENGALLKIAGQSVSPLSATNTGTLQVKSGGILVFDSLIVHNNIVLVDVGATMDLTNATIAGGLLTGLGTIQTLGSGSTSTLDGTSGHTVTIANGTTVTVNTGTTLDLEGTIASGGSSAQILVAGASTIIANGTISLPVNANGLADNALLTLQGSSALTVTHLIGNLDAHAFAGALNVTTGDVASGLSIATGGGANIIDATALTDAHVLTLTGNNAVTVTLNAGDLAAGSYTGKITVTGGTGTNVITTGNGDDIITAGAGADTLAGGSGSDIFAFAAGDSVLSITGSAGTIGNISGYDVITDFTPDITDKLSYAGANIATSFTTTNHSLLFLHSWRRGTIAQYHSGRNYYV